MSSLHGRQMGLSKSICNDLTNSCAGLLFHVHGSESSVWGLQHRAVYNHWTGPVDWTGGLDWWTGLVDSLKPFANLFPCMNSNSLRDL